MPTNAKDFCLVIMPADRIEMVSIKNSDYSLILGDSSSFPRSIIKIETVGHAVFINLRNNKASRDLLLLFRF